MAGVPSPTATHLVQSTLGDLSDCYVAKPTVKNLLSSRKPIHLPCSIHLATACLLTFSGFLRSGKLVNIRPCDLEIQQCHLAIYIPLPTYSAAMLEEYMRKDNIHAASESKNYN